MAGSDVPDTNLHPLFDGERDVVTEAAALQALAHPLRLRLLGLLRLYGPSTATRLAERCGQSPALISYHLRKLAEGNAIVEAAAADLVGETVHGRDRWWKAARRSTFTDLPPEGDDESAAVHDDFATAVLALYSDRAQGWLSAQHAWPREWRDASTFSDVPLRLTADETARLTKDIATLLAGYRRHDPADSPTEEPEGTRIVSAQFLVFPDPDQQPPAA